MDGGSADVCVCCVQIQHYLILSKNKHFYYNYYFHEANKKMSGGCYTRYCVINVVKGAFSSFYFNNIAVTVLMFLYYNETNK